MVKPHSKGAIRRYRGNKSRQQHKRRKHSLIQCNQNSEKYRLHRNREDDEDDEYDRRPATPPPPPSSSPSVAVLKKF